MQDKHHLRVLLYVADGSKSGASVALGWFCHRLLECGQFDVTLFLANYSKKMEGLPDGVAQVGYPSWVTRERMGARTVYRMVTHPLLTWQQWGFRLITRFPQMPNGLKNLFCAYRKRFDVAISYTDDFTNKTVGGFSADRHFGWCHEDYSVERHITSNLESARNYLRRLDGIFCVSNSSRTALISLMGSEFSARVSVFHNLFPICTICKVAEIRQEAACVDIVSVGRLVGVKRFEWCLTAAEQLKRRGVRFHWKIAGDGPLKEALEKDVTLRGLNGCVSFPGRVKDWLKMCNTQTIYVQTSSSEGWGLAVEEASLAGMRVVCSNLPVFREVSDWIGHKFIYFHSPTELADAIVAASIMPNLSANADNIDMIRFGYEADWSNFVRSIEGVADSSNGREVLSSRR